ncbi:MAG: hypothetical protein OEY56_13035, partial [Cyclobacteriaceae bacterium]|nr:hypothetical protein [Cyclobacteriaceae bacterium]
MKGVIIPVFFIFLFFSAHFAHSQFEVDVLLEKATYLLYDCQFEGALRLNEKADSIALTKNDQILHAKTVNQRAYFFARIGQNDSAAYLLARQSKMAFENKWFPVYYESRFYTGVNQLFMGNLPAAKQTFSSLLDELSHSSKDQSQLLGRTLTNLALIAFAESDISSAEYLVSQSNLYLENEESTLFKVSNMNLQALLFHKRGKMLDAINWYKNTLDEYRKSGRTLNKPNVYLGIANVYGDLGKTVPAKMYLDSARILARSTGQVQELGLIYEASFTYYFEQKDFQKSIDFLLLKSKLVDSLRSAERIIAVEKTELLGQKALDEVKMDLLERQLENQEKNNRKQKVWVFLAIVVSLYMVGFVIAFKRLINQKNTSQKALIERNKELLNKNEQIAQTQNRLIQSEKMALLGRLSAGIAHELNSPLSAIKANLELVDNLQYDELRGMVRLSSQVSYEEIEGLQELIEYSILSHQQSVSTAEDRKRKEWVREYLSKESIDHKEEIIEFFEELKIREGIQKFEWIYKHRYSVDLLELSLNMVNRFTSVSIARKAIGQTEK